MAKPKIKKPTKQMLTQALADFAIGLLLLIIEKIIKQTPLLYIIITPLSSAMIKNLLFTLGVFFILLGIVRLIYLLVRRKDD